jgi:hypothetical protein
MPSGPPYLHKKFGDDFTACKVLAQYGVVVLNGTIHKKSSQTYEKEVWDAMRYLIEEWDYDFINE